MKRYLIAALFWLLASPALAGVSCTLPFTRYVEGVERLKNKTAIKVLFDPWAE